MSTGQIVIIGLGVIMVLSSLDLSSLFNKIPSSSPSPAVKPKNDLIAVVQKWDDLRNVCIINGLTEATTKLDEIFPMLIKVDK